MSFSTTFREEISFESFNRVFSSFSFFFFFLTTLPLFSATLLQDPIYSERGFATFKNSVEELNIGGYVDIDGRLFLGNDPFKSTFLINKARFYMTGKLYKTFGFMFMPSWEKLENVDLHYAWIETLHPNWAQVRVGLFKEPFSLEALTTVLYLNFIERSMAIRNYCQIYDVGIMLYGKLPSYYLVYGVGLFNGRGKDKLDNNNNKELVGRVTIHALRSKSFGQLYIGMSAATGMQDEKLSQTEFITEADTPFWKWKKNIHLHDNRVRWGVDFEYFRGPLSWYAEYIYTNWGNVRKGAHHKSFEGHGGYVDFAYLLTGEDKPRNAPVIPKHNFNPCTGGLGAWEIAARYEFFYGSKKMMTAGFAKGANFLHGPILGVNWFLNPLTVVRLNGQYIWFNRSFRIKSHKIDQEIYVIGRIQFVF